MSISETRPKGTRVLWCLEVLEPDMFLEVHLHGVLLGLPKH